jgi:hypothetical protein
MQADYIFDQIIDIADTTKEGVIIKDGPDGREVTTADMIQHRRLQVDARKWVVSKLLPKKFGDKIDVTSGDEKLNSTTVITLGNGKTLNA